MVTTVINSGTTTCSVCLLLKRGERPTGQRGWPEASAIGCAQALRPEEAADGVADAVFFAGLEAAVDVEGELG